MVINSATLRAANKGFRKLYEGGLAKAGKRRIGDYAFAATSTSAEENYAWLGALPGLRKLVGEVNVRNLADHGFKVANEEFELTVGVKRVDIERDTLGVYSNWFTIAGTRAAAHPDKLLAEAMVAGFATKCYTGKNFFDDDHAPQGAKKGKFSNKGTKKLSAANFVLGLRSLRERKDAEGEPINESPDVVLVVSPKWQEEAEKILVATTINNGETNVNKGKARIDVWNRLAGANEDMWFLFDMGAVVKPFVHQVEVPLEYKSLDDPESERVMLKQEFLHQVYGRHAVAALVPELAYGSTGADPA